MKGETYGAELGVQWQATESWRLHTAYTQLKMNLHRRAGLAASAGHQWGAYYTKAVGDVIGGTWKSGDIWGGFKEGMIKLAPLNPAIPANVKDEVGKIEADLKAGKFHPFTGPVKDQDGKVRLAAGQVMSDEDLGKMNYFVEGVASKLP